MKLLTAGFHDMPAPEFLKLRNMDWHEAHIWKLIIGNARDCKVSD